jgi:hypothetical protein
VKIEEYLRGKMGAGSHLLVSDKTGRAPHT